MTVLLASLVDVTIVIALALMAVAMMRRRSAAQRHAVLAVAILAALIVPALELFLPQLPLVRWGAAADPVSSGLTVTAAAVPAAGDVTVVPQDAPVFPWVTAAVVVWLLGVTLTLGGLLADLVRLARLTARCTILTTGEWRNTADELIRTSAIRRRVDLLQSADPSLLVVCGVLKPRIILPAGAASWHDDRRRVVVAHELAHVRRWDGVFQLACELLRSVHWFNPIVWLCCRRLRRESEHACDDAVLSRGFGATEYATHLLDVAKHAAGPRHALISASAIAHPSTLERRISAMLNRHENRRPCTRRAWACVVLASLAVIVPLAAAGVAPTSESQAVASVPGRDVVLAVSPMATPAPSQAPVVKPPKPVKAAQPVAPVAAAVAAQAAPTSISGTVLDSSGAALPGVALTLTDRDFGLQFAAVSDPSGRFAFPALQPARYDLVASLPGFASVTSVVALAAGVPADRVITLPVGTLEETVTVSCSSTAAAAWNRARQFFVPVLSAQLRSVLPVRVGGVVRLATRITGANPLCPKTAMPFPQIAVILVGHVDVNGVITEVRRAGSDGAPPSEFIESALAAVRQWTYTPTLLNGQPTAVNVMVRVVYRRM